MTDLIIIPCLCQRWVTEKLSVESLRDLELFGGENKDNSGHSDAATLLNPSVLAYQIYVYLDLFNSNIFL